jgi:hypothetical protein
MHRALRAVSLLMWSREVGGVRFSLSENGHEHLASLYTHRETASRGMQLKETA